MTWKASSIAIFTFLLIGISVGTFTIHVVKSTPPSLAPDAEPISRDQLNITIPPEIRLWTDLDNITDSWNITVLPDLWGRPIIPQTSYYGVLPLSLMNLAVEAMVSGWIAVLVSCVTFYSLRRSFVWSRRKTLLISVLTIVGGVSLTLISWFRQVTHTMLGWHIYDASYIFYGYPFVWFKASWGYFAPPNSHWQYTTQLYGLVGNIVFYMWIIFGSLVGFMILHKRIRKNPQLQKTS